MGTMLRLHPPLKQATQRVQKMLGGVRRARRHTSVDRAAGNLTGLATCACCGAGMTRTGTRRRNRSYSYYSCGGCHQKGRSVCLGRHISMAKLDGLVIENVKERLFTPERLTTILESLLERKRAKNCGCGSACRATYRTRFHQRKTQPALSRDRGWHRRS